jgi:hypothetical protein
MKLFDLDIGFVFKESLLVLGPIRVESAVWTVPSTLARKARSPKTRAYVPALAMAMPMAWIDSRTATMARGRKGDRPADVQKRKKTPSEAQEDNPVTQQRRPNPFLRSWAWKREHRYYSSFLAFVLPVGSGLRRLLSVFDYCQIDTLPIWKWEFL